MKLDLGDYRIETDSMQYIIKRKKIVQAGKYTKDENVGKERWEDISYHSSLYSALKSLCNQTILDNDDIFVVQKKLNELQGDIRQLTRALKGGDIDG